MSISPFIHRNNNIAYFCCRYIKGFDPNNWLTIDPVTAEIKLNKMPDRESPHLVNGTYFAKILCVSEGMLLYCINADTSKIIYVRGVPLKSSFGIATPGNFSLISQANFLYCEIKKHKCNTTGDSFY